MVSKVMNIFDLKDKDKRQKNIFKTKRSKTLFSSSIYFINQLRKSWIYNHSSSMVTPKTSVQCVKK